MKENLKKLLALKKQLVFFRKSEYISLFVFSKNLSLCIFLYTFVRYDILTTVIFSIEQKRGKKVDGNDDQDTDADDADIDLENQLQEEINCKEVNRKKEKVNVTQKINAMLEKQAKININAQLEKEAKELIGVHKTQKR